MNVGEIFVALGFDVDDGKLKGFDDGVKGVTSSMWAAAAGAAAAVYTLNAFVNDAVKGASAMRQFRQETGLSTDELQKWQVAGRLSNIELTPEKTMASIKNLQKAITDVQWGGGNSAPFKWLGLDIMHGQDAFAVLKQLRKTVQENPMNFTPARMSSLVSQLGLDPSMISVLKLSNEEFEKFYNSKILSPEAQKKLEDLGLAIEGVKVQFELLKKQTIADWAPAIIDFLNSAVPLMQEFGRNIGAVVGLLKDFWDGFSSDEKTAFKIWLGVILALLFPWTAVLAGIVWLLNEMGKYLRGLPSIFDTVSEGIEKVIAAWTRLKDIWKGGKIDLNPGHWLQNGKDNFNYLFGDQASHGASMAPATSGATSNKNATFNNNFTIHGNADPHTTSKIISRDIQNQNNYAMDGFNNGMKN